MPWDTFPKRLFDAIRRPVAVIRITKVLWANLPGWKIFLKDRDGLHLLRHVTNRKIWHTRTDASEKLGMRRCFFDNTGDVFQRRVSVM